MTFARNETASPLVMPYALTLQPCPAFLRARVTGTNSKETARAYTLEIHDACVQRNVPRATGLLKRIALVDLNPEHDASRMEFAEDLAFDRGVDFRLFASVAAAECWLRAMPVGAGEPGAR